MPSKKKGKASSTDEKRAKRPRACDYSREFSKDWDRFNDTGRFNMNDLKQVMMLLIADEGPLPRQYRDHKLEDSRRWKDCRECHIHGDYLLVYRLTDNERTVVFTAIGTHSELFG